MIDTIEVTIDGKKHNYTKDITLEEIYSEHQGEHKYPILLARVDNRIRDLSYQLKNDCNVEFLDLTTSEGNRVHVSALTFILLYAVKRLFGKSSNVTVQHSIDKSVYFITNFKLTEEKLETIKKEMKEIIKNDMPITKLTVDRLEAIKYFNDTGDVVKADIMKYNTNNYITLYRLGNIYNFFYNLMPISTGQARDFDLTFINQNGFVLRFPTVYDNEKIPKYKHHQLMFDVYTEYREWAKLMNIENSSDLNRVVSSGKINDLIKIDETLQGGRLLRIAKDISDKRDKLKVILLAGPSSSGKTTTSRKLTMYLEAFGLHPKALSMDDYFLERDKTPKDENGKYDFESIDALDLKLLDTQVRALLKGEKITLPTYNFKYGEKEFREEMQLGENDILIIEGIHALDDKLTKNAPRDVIYKIYISPLTELNIDNHNRISTSDSRLLRRIVRDNRTRSYPVERTLSQWANVRKGEEKWIFPYQDDNDAIINTAAIYEIGVLKTYVEPLLYSVESDSPYYEDAKRLLNFLRLFLPISADAIPEDAIIREFIGGSYFHE